MNTHFDGFIHLVQVNEETGNRRPVMLTVQRVPRMPKPSKSGNAADSEREEEQRAKSEDTQADAGENQTRTDAFCFSDNFDSFYTWNKIYFGNEYRVFWLVQTQRP